jgi:hypothetical protein
VKRLAARCPLCQQLIELPDEPLAHDVAIRQHAFTHTIDEWIVGVQDLRNQMMNDGMLRNMPRCAMPRA